VTKAFRWAKPPLWRIVLIAVVTWFFLTAWFAPGLNPLILFVVNRDGETAAMVGMVRHDMLLAQSEAEGFLVREGHWPATPRDLYRVDNNGLLKFEIPTDHVLRFTFGNGFDTDTGLRNTTIEWRYAPATKTWACVAGAPMPPRRWLPEECRPPVSRGADLLLWLVVIVAALVLAGWIWLQRFDARLTAIRESPMRLRRQSIGELSGIDWRLRLLVRRHSTLSAAGIAPEDWFDALRWPALESSVRTLALANRVGAIQTEASGWSLRGNVFEWQLPSSLPIAVDRVVVYVPEAGLLPREIVQQLQHQRTGQDILVVISPNARADTALIAWGADPTHLGVVIDQSTLTEWLVSSRPEDVFTRALTRQLRVTRISPYQTRGGVTRPGVFFGRTQLLARVIHREPGNYLLVGGRQLGKTSLMKAIERRFADHPDVCCLYVSLRDHLLTPRLAQAAGLAADAPLDRIIATLKAKSGRRRLLLMLDECDLFLRADATRGYPELSSLRAASEEGSCRFLLAGFWDLYEAVALDFASPIRNFGEVIRLGALEQDACLSLATEPMRQLGVTWERQELAERMVASCGHRANLVAIVCQHVLEHLGAGERVVRGDHVYAALRSESIQDALAGWSRLSPDPSDCALDRALVYRVAQSVLANDSPPTMPEWLATLEDAGVVVPPESVRRSFARLRLAYVLTSIGDADDPASGEPPNTRYRFAVPMQVTQFDAGEVEALLVRELRGLVG